MNAQEFNEVIQSRLTTVIDEIHEIKRSAARLHGYGGLCQHASNALIRTAMDIQAQYRINQELTSEFEVGKKPNKT